MNINLAKANFEEILPFRRLFLHETNVQIRYNACHERGWSDSYLILCNNVAVGYGAVKGKEHLQDRDAVFEFFVIPPFRHLVDGAFTKLLRVSGARFIECQSNDRLLSSLLYRFGKNISASTILFRDFHTTSIAGEDLLVRKRSESDVLFQHNVEEPGEYVLLQNENVVGTGGFTLYYNPPFVDIYMEVDARFHRKGYGSFLVQELKKQCYLQGRVPAARCSANNPASKATLLRAGFEIAGFMLLGEVANNQ
jgi:GNAT superfamily N-acetyltransferase